MQAHTFNSDTACLNKNYVLTEHCYLFNSGNSLAFYFTIIADF